MAAINKKKIIYTLSFIVVGLGYYLFTSITKIGIPCMFETVTGMSCPGCGVTRSLSSIIEGDIAGAFQYNFGLMILSPIILVIIAYTWYMWMHDKAASNKVITIVTIVVLVLLIIWMVIRNIYGI